MKKYLLITFFIFCFYRSHAQWDWSDACDSVIEFDAPMLDIGNNTDYSGFDILDSASLSGKQLVLIGGHEDESTFNRKTGFKILRYLNYSAGITDLITTISSTQAFYINKFILDQDSAAESILSLFLGNSEFSKYRQLKRLNMQLPDSLKIRVHGSIPEDNYRLVVLRMAELIRKDDIPDHLRIAVEAMLGAARYITIDGSGDEEEYSYDESAFELDESVEEFMSQYDTLRPLFADWLGTEFKTFEAALNAIQEYDTYDAYYYSALKFTAEEEFIYSRVIELLREHPEKKYAGIFDLCRVNPSVTEIGCELYKFKGLSYKISRTEAFSSKVLNIGIFSREVMENQTRSSDMTHFMYETELDSLFCKVPYNEAFFYRPVLLDSGKSIATDFGFIVLNHHYDLGDMDEEEIAASDSSEPGYGWDFSDENANYRRSRLYLGIGIQSPFLDLKSINNDLKQNGRDTLGYAQQESVEFFVCEDEGLGGLYLSRFTSRNRDFGGWVAGLRGGGTFVYKRFVKFALMSGMSYGEFRYTSRTAVTPATYFSDYEAPLVYKKPVCLFSLSTDLYLDFSPVYIYGSLGYQYDALPGGWKLNGQRTGSNGQLKATGLFYNWGAGLSIPLRYFE